MVINGLSVDLQTIRTLRKEFRELSMNLRHQLNETDESIGRVAQTWQDKNFQDFSNKFRNDKDRLEPLFQQVDRFEGDFLDRVERNLIAYLKLKGTI